MDNVLVGAAVLAALSVLVVVRGWIRVVRDINRDWEDHQRQLADRKG